jgi:O-methyltransferase involved in polyketide biosynthesis
MRDHRPSRTAIAVAILRAAHQLVDSPLIFEDPLALQILRPYADKVRDAARKDRPQLFLRGRMLRLFAAVRSRFCEDELTKAWLAEWGNMF